MLPSSSLQSNHSRCEAKSMRHFGPCHAPPHASGRISGSRWPTRTEACSPQRYSERLPATCRSHKSSCLRNHRLKFVYRTHCVPAVLLGISMPSTHPLTCVYEPQVEQQEAAHHQRRRCQHNPQKHLQGMQRQCQSVKCSLARRPCRTDWSSAGRLAGGSSTCNTSKDHAVAVPDIVTWLCTSDLPVCHSWQQSTPPGW